MPKTDDLIRVRHMPDAACKAIEFTAESNKKDLYNFAKTCIAA